MSNCSKSILIAVLLFLLAVFAPLVFRNAAAQEGKPPALPLPEMQKLSKLYVGTWTFTETYPKSPMAPNGGENTGIYTSELGPGGNSIFNHFHSKGPVGEFDGTIVMTWDPKEKSTRRISSVIPSRLRLSKPASGRMTRSSFASNSPWARQKSRSAASPSSCPMESSPAKNSPASTAPRKPSSSTSPPPENNAVGR